MSDLEFNTLGEKIIYFRKQKGISQIKLGSLVDKAKSTIGGYESNEYRPDEDTLSKLEEVLAIPDEYRGNIQSKESVVPKVTAKSKTPEKKVAILEVPGVSNDELILRLKYIAVETTLLAERVQGNEQEKAPVDERVAEIKETFYKLRELVFNYGRDVTPDEIMELRKAINPRDAGNLNAMINAIYKDDDLRAFVFDSIYVPKGGE